MEWDKLCEMDLGEIRRNILFLAPKMLHFGSLEHGAHDYAKFNATVHCNETFPIPQKIME